MESQGANAAGKAAVFAFGTVSMLVQKAMQDGTLAAAGRQGIGELGAALKAFPDAIQAHETGSIWHPTQGEVAADRKESVFWPGHRSPTGIVSGGHGVHGPEQSKAAAPTPSQIVANCEHGAGDDGQVLTQQTWEEKILAERKARGEGNADNDSYERGRGRSLPDEQKEEQQERDRGRGR